MINTLRSYFDNALSQISDLDAFNAGGGVAVWTAPPTAAKAYNPIIFSATVYKAVTPSNPIAGTTVNVAQAVHEGGTTIVRFTYPVASRITLVMTDQNESTQTLTVTAGATESPRIADGYYQIQSITPAKDAQYIYVAAGTALDAGDYLIASSGAVFYRTNDVSTVTLTLVVKGERITLTAETFLGKADMDVSAIVRTYFAPHIFNIEGGGLADDPALAVTYSAEAQGLTFGSFGAINAVAQVGERADYTDAPNHLSLAKIYHKYDGYPLDYSVLGGISVVRAGIVGAMVTPIIAVEDCTPPSPFYVRWVNALGGVDYWMFSKRQEFTPSVSSTSTYAQYKADPATAITNRRAYALATKNSVTVGAEGVQAIHWDMLEGLPFSPLIEWYNEKLGKWIGITVAKYEGKIVTDTNTHTIEITFDLPTINTQF